MFFTDDPWIIPGTSGTASGRKPQKAGIFSHTPTSDVIILPHVFTVHTQPRPAKRECVLAKSMMYVITVTSSAALQHLVASHCDTGDF